MLFEAWHAQTRRFSAFSLARSKLARSAFKMIITIVRSLTTVAFLICSPRLMRRTQTRLRSLARRVHLAFLWLSAESIINLKTPTSVYLKLIYSRLRKASVAARTAAAYDATVRLIEFLIHSLHGHGRSHVSVKI